MLGKCKKNPLHSNMSLALAKGRLMHLCGAPYPNMILLTTLKKKPFENIARKGENAGNQHFLLFPQCFLPCQRQIKEFQ